MKRINLFVKTFATLLTLMLGSIVIAYIILYELMPYFYKDYKSSQMDNEMHQICMNRELTLSDFKESLSALADEYNLNAVISDINGKIIFDVATMNSYHYSTVDSDFEIITDETDTNQDYIVDDYSITYNSETTGNTLEKKYSVSIDESKYTVTMQLPLQPLDESKNVLIIIFPISAAICFALSLGGSYFFAGYITRPIKTIASTTALMAELNPKEHIVMNRKDEIGDLADSINVMYDNLMRSISELEQKIEEVQISEAVKIDFLRTASHELKTPISSVNALLEGMLYNVPPYDDRDTYIKQCQSILASANILIKNTLDLSNENTEIKKVFLKEAVMEEVQFLSLIAMQRKIAIKVNIPNDVQIYTRTDSLKKALINIISNAVNFSEHNKSVLIDYKENILTVFNSCQPLSESDAKAIFAPFKRLRVPDDSENIGNGLGMSIIERALKICDVDYKFIRADTNDGMVFICDLKNIICR